jgi:hypothetical protein
MQPNKERAAEIALCGALTCVAGAAYADFFSGWQFAVPVVGGAAAPALLVAVATQRGWGSGRAALVGVLVLPVAAAALLLALPGTGVSSVGDAAGTVLGGTVDGWAAMLAAGLPADLHGDLLVTPLALSWLASLAACLLAVHASGPIVPLGPPTVALAGSLALTGDAASNRLALAVAFLGLALVLMLVRANRAVATALTEALPSAGAPSPEARASSPSAARLHTPAGRVAFGVPLVVGIAVASPLAAGALPPARGDRLDPRDLRDQRLEIDDVFSPLVVLKSQLKADPSRPRFRITVDAGDAPTPDRVRTAASTPTTERCGPRPVTTGVPGTSCRATRRSGTRRPAAPCARASRSSTSRARSCPPWVVRSASTPAPTARRWSASIRWPERWCRPGPACGASATTW